MLVIHLIEPLEEVDTERSNFIAAAQKFLCSEDVSVKIYDQIPGLSTKQKAVWLYDSINHSNDQL